MKDSRARTIIEVVGVASVLIGLIFVGYELRQNTAALQATAFQDYTDGTIDFLLTVAADEGLAEAWAKLQTGSADVEGLRAAFLVRSQWMRYQNAFSQWQRGSMSDSDWTVSRQQICRAPDAENYYAARGAQVRRESWEEHKPYMTQEFIEFVEQCWAE